MRSLLKELREHKIHLSLENENLKIHFSQDRIPETILSKIKEHKQELTKYLSTNLQDHKEKENRIPVVPVSNDGYILSSSQERMWILSQFGEASLAYHLPNIVELKGAYDIEVLQNAIKAVVKRHEILRTRFNENKNGEIKQWIYPIEEENFEIEIINLSTEENAKEQVEIYVRKDNLIPFDLKKGPLFRVKLFKIPNDEYIFYYNMHHIIGDGWSLKVLMKDVLEQYKAILTPKVTHSKSLPIQYKDYATWQRQKVQDGQFDSSRIYWMEKLSGILNTLDLPTEIKRPLVKTYKGRTLKTYFSVETTQKLKDYSKENQGTLFITLLSFWNILLYRYTGQKDITIGSLVAGRDHPDIQEQIGFYVNTLAFRNRIDPSLSVKRTYEQIRIETLEAFKHQDYPFDRLVNDLETKMDVGRNPIFDILLTLQNTGKQLENIEIAPEAIHKIIDEGESFAKFDLEILFEENNGYLCFTMDFNEDIYTSSLITQLMSHFKNLTNEIIKNSDQPVGSISFLSDTEINTLNHVFNRIPKKSVVESKTIVEIFREIASSSNTNAIRFKDTILTYKELDHRSDQLALYLRRNYDLTANASIGILLPRSEWLIVTILGVLKAGCAYVPMDLNYPQSRIDFIVKDAVCKCVIDEVFIEDFVKDSPVGKTLDIEIQPNDLAYIIYTSGSTGIPKGVMITHENVTSFIHEIDKKLGYEAYTKIAAITNLTFDIAVLEIIGTLCLGKEIVLFDEESINVQTFIDTLKTQEVEVLQLTPSLLQSVIDPIFSTMGLRLKKMIVGGEPFPQKIYDRLKNQSEIEVVNVYGPTEATVWSTFLPINGSEELSIGTPFANEQVYILNEFNELQPIGVTGEMCIGGSGVAKGYINKKQLTQNRFIENPFVKGTRLYKTGDLGYWTPSGTIKCIGRVDDQVKIRGHRIELGEITNSLLEHEEIHEVVVLVRASKNDEKELVAYMVARTELNTKDIRHYLMTKLPRYMIPEYYVQMQVIPLMINGKVNRKALPDPLEVGVDSGELYVPPANEIEKKLVSILQYELGRERIGLNDNFFDLGANSLKLLRILGIINESFNMNLKPIQLFQYPNITSLINNVFQKEKIQENEEEEIGLELDDMIDLMNQ